MPKFHVIVKQIYIVQLDQGKNDRVWFFQRILTCLKQSFRFIAHYNKWKASSGFLLEVWNLKKYKMELLILWIRFDYHRVPKITLTLLFNYFFESIHTEIGIMSLKDCFRVLVMSSGCNIPGREAEIIIIISSTITISAIIAITPPGAGWSISTLLLPTRRNP